MFTYQIIIKMHHTDAAGRLFFGHQFAIIHDAYEAFLEHIGLPFSDILKNKDFFLPIVHAESDYKKQLFVGDLIEIELKVSRIGKTSFNVEYELKNTEQKIVGTSQTIHVCVDNQKESKRSLPEDLKEKLNSFMGV